MSSFVEATLGISLEAHDSAGPADEGIADLIARVLGRGSSNASSYAASERLLRYFGSAADIARASCEEIRRHGDISDRQASLLAAALALGRQLWASPLRPGEQFSNSRDIFVRYRARFLAASKEYFLSLHLNSKNRLIREVLVSIGSLTCSVVHPREVFAPAVRDSSAAVLFLHNHPSGDPQPSREDRDCTQRLLKAGKIIGIRVLDHVILGHDDYFSFADSGLLREME